LALKTLRAKSAKTHFWFKDTGIFGHLKSSNHMPALYSQLIESPIGHILIQSNERAITSIAFTDEPTLANNEHYVTRLAVLQLGEYFENKRKKFELPLETNGSDFSKLVLNEVVNIPFGKTKSYKDVAMKIGQVHKSRAVGQANGKNKILIVIPCRRVVGSEGDLIGYSGGISRKEWLLKHEGIALPNNLF